MILAYKKVSLVTGIATGMLLAVTSISANAAPASTGANKAASSVYVPKSTVTATSPTLAQVGYSFGYLMGESNKDSIDDLNLDAFFQGFRDAYSAQSPNLDKKQMQKVLLDYQKNKEIAYAKEVQALAASNAAKGKQFLLQNGKKSGVMTTASGLQYQVLTQGSGKSPKATDKVKVHYEGRLIDGTIFDSSYKRGEPVTFPLNQVIKGWTEGLQLMKEGGKYRLFVPANLGYGEAGNADIEPNSVLIFDIELLQVNPPVTQPVKL